MADTAPTFDHSDACRIAAALEVIAKELGKINRHLAMTPEGLALQIEEIWRNQEKAGGRRP